MFELRRTAFSMMPKHIFETVDDPVTFTFSEPVVLGVSTRRSSRIPNGFWELYERREDWQRTPAGIIVDNPGPKYVLRSSTATVKKAIAMSRGELDVFSDGFWKRSRPFSIRHRRRSVH
ncbi:MAG: hypothetical protein R2838_15600 [Caldilineaceae bacterium]